MANKDNLLTVKEYAELKKVSVQYVYKLLLQQVSHRDFGSHVLSPFAYA